MERIASLLEKTLKFASGFIGLVAAIGYPTTYINFKNLGVPSNFISYENMLRAGIVPAFVALIIAMYVYLIPNWFFGYWTYTNPNDERPRWRPIIGFLPLSLPILIVVFLGLVSLLILFDRVILWLPFRLIESLFHTTISDRQQIIIILFITGSYMIFNWKRLFLYQKKKGDSSESNSIPQNVSGTTENSSQNEKVKRKGKLGKISAIGVAILAVGIVYLFFLLLIVAINFVINLWDPTLYARTSNLNVYNLAAILVLFLAAIIIFGAAALLIKDEQIKKFAFPRLIAIFILSVYALTLYILLISFYSNGYYQKIDQGLGGGKPQMVTIMISKDYLLDSVNSDVMPSCQPTEGNLIQCKNLYMFYIDNKSVIIANEHDLPTSVWLIPRDKIFAFSWSNR